MGASRRNVRSLSLMPVRLSHRCFSMETKAAIDRPRPACAQVIEQVSLIRPYKHHGLQRGTSLTRCLESLHHSLSLYNVW